MPNIVVVDLGHVTVDGEPVGSILDLAWNRPQIEGIQGLALTALQAWVNARDQAHQAAATETLAAKDAVIADLQSQVTDLQGQVATLGGTELARQLAAEQARQKIEARIAELNAELAAMDQPAS